MLANVFSLSILEIFDLRISTRGNNRPTRRNEITKRKKISTLKRQWMSNEFHRDIIFYFWRLFASTLLTLYKYEKEYRTVSDQYLKKKSLLVWIRYIDKSSKSILVLRKKNVSSNDSFQMYEGRTWSIAVSIHMITHVINSLAFESLRKFQWNL